MKKPSKQPTSMDMFTADLLLFQLFIKQLSVWQISAGPRQQNCLGGKFLLTVASTVILVCHLSESQ
jgi:hypothetical protein